MLLENVEYWDHCYFHVFESGPVYYPKTFESSPYINKTHIVITVYNIVLNDNVGDDDAQFPPKIWSVFTEKLNIFLHWGCLNIFVLVDDPLLGIQSDA